jgi:hypothetical protein
MIALVYPPGKATWTDELRKWADQGLAEASQRDGVEVCLSVHDPDTDDTFTVIVYRDQAAMDAAQRQASERSVADRVKEFGVEASLLQPRVYSDVICHA